MRKSINILAFCLMLIVPAQVFSAFEAGKHYVEIPFSESLNTGKSVEVREFFWYGCGHCFQFEPILQAWKKNKSENANFVTTPAFLPRREAHAKAFYAFDSIGKHEKLHTVFFSALHVERRKLENVDDIANFVAQNGEDKKAFLSAYNSFGTDHKVKQATQLGLKYGVNSVPTLIVDGRYLITASMAGGNEGMLKVVDYLVAKVAKEKNRKRK